MYKEIKIGIYRIRNIINEKVYIGSSINIRGRWAEHKRELKNNNHHSKHLQRAWNKHEKENFKFEIIEECDRDILLEREQYYLDLYKSYDGNYGYNVSKSSSAPMMGRKHSEETKKKLTEEIRNRDSSSWLRGEDKFNSKFKDEDIINIKKMIFEGTRIVDIANKYNVEANTITQIKTGERWCHIETEYDDLIIQTPKTKLTNESDIVNIKRRLANNEDTRGIAEMYNVSRGTIYAIKQLRTWKDIGSEYNEVILNRDLQRILTKEQTKEIIELLKDNKIKQSEISKMYGVSKYVVHGIKQRYLSKRIV